MNLFQHHIFGNKRKWYWYISLGIGLLPCLIRLCMASGNDIPCFDIKDLLFAGLTMNLANFSQLNNPNFELKEILALISGILIAILCVFISLFLSKEQANVEPPHLFVYILSILPVLGSAFINYQAYSFE